VGPNGDLYIADQIRNQILQRLPNGEFTVVAGTGTAGFSGDGGPAQQATLHDPSGMAFAANGTLYFADQGSNRVRSIAPGGVIETVAGGGDAGHSGFVSSGTAALQASINPSDVAFGPGGRLYIATFEQVVRLEIDGTLTPVVGSPDSPEGLYGVGGPATAGSADGANGIAFDSAGDLFVAGFNTKSLLMVTSAGLLTQPPDSTNFYPRGSAGLASNAHGAVVAMDGLTVGSVTPQGIKTLVNFMAAPLNSIEGFQPNGVAVGPDGTIYLDTSGGNGFTNRSAIVSINPESFRSDILWEGPVNQRG